MDARAKTVREILYSGDQYIIPFFQRYYSWRRKHWERLRDDLWSLVEDNTNNLHFLGPLVCTPMGHVPGEVPAYQLIDGQQRLTTITVLLAALRDVARENGLDELAGEINEDYLVHKRKKGLQRFKIVPRIGDREAFMCILEGKDLKEHRGLAVVQAWQYYRKCIAERAAQNPESWLDDLFTAINGKLSLVVITIDKENPYEIFESLNSTGLPLEESDLIRNYLFMQVPTEDQEEFHTNHWEPFEKMFDESGKDPAIPATAFYRDYLMRRGEYSKAKMTFVGFKEENRKRQIAPVTQVEELKHFAALELMLRRPHKCQPESIQKALHQIAMLEITTAHPLLLNLLDRQARGEMAEVELLGCLDDLSSFVLRRSICGESTRAYGRWFSEAVKSIQDEPRSDLRSYWLRRGWPDDKAFVARLQDFPIYRREMKKCRMILHSLEESYGHKEKVNPGNLTIEHVMPQSIKAGKAAAAWKSMLGDDWKTVHETWLHTLGNLTLSGYNPDLGNKPFEEKQVLLAGSNLLLNKHFTDLAEWNETAIRLRGETLADEVAKLWPRPEGGPRYIGPTVVTEEKLTTEMRHERRQEFWKGLLEFMGQRNRIDNLPKSAANGWLYFPMGSAMFRLVVLGKPGNKEVGVALVCRGKNARANFEALRNEKTTLESEIGSGLQWLEKRNGETFHIALRRHGIDMHNKSAWPQLHEWLAETVETFQRAFIERCAALLPDEPKVARRHILRKEFWTSLLERSAPRTRLHSGLSPSIHSWIGTGAGLTGFAYNYVVTMNSASTELYIDRGKGRKKENEQFFDTLRDGKQAIEDAFGEQLEWERLDDKRACRIARHFSDSGFLSTPEDWPAIQDSLIDAMIRLEEALSPHIAQLKQSLADHQTDAEDPPPARPLDAVRRVPISEEEFFAQFNSERTEDEQRVARQLIAWAESTGLRPSFARGERGAAFMPVLTHGPVAREYYPISIQVRGVLVIQMRWLKNLPPFDDPAERDNLRLLLEGIPGLRVTKHGLEGLPRFNLKDLVDNEPLVRLVESLDWLVDRIRADEGK